MSAQCNNRAFQGNGLEAFKKAIFVYIEHTSNPLRISHTFKTKIKTQIGKFK